MNRRIVLVVVAIVFVGLPVVATANTLWSSDCDVMFDPISTFDVGDTVCVTGDLDHVIAGQVFPSAHVYIVKNRVWQLGDLFVDHTGDPDLIVTTAGAGAFISEVVQGPPLEPGEYDLVLDEYGDGVYTSADLIVGVGTDYALAVVTDAFFFDGFESGTAPWSRVVGSTYGTEVDGFPAWFERAMTVVNNAARMAPQEYRDTYMLDYSPAATGILLAENYSAVEPLIYSEGLNRAARYHADDLSTNGCGMVHYSCDGTSAGTRVNSFLTPPCWYRGEILAFNVDEPRRQINFWLCETYGGGECCPDGGGCGHRNKLMSSPLDAHGAGVSYGYAVLDYATGCTRYRPPLVDGSHIFFAGEILFMATYFDSPGYPPQEVVLVLDAVEHAMSLDIGQPQAGTYAVSIAGSGQCRSYHFRATTSPGLSYRYPAEGELATYGDNCSETWVP